MLGSLLLILITAAQGYTYEQDVYAINNLYASLGAPPIPGWILNGGDPCVESWQGVRCVGPNITGIILNDANLGGELGDKLANFTSIITIDLRNNHIGGSLPENLPITTREFFLSENQISGSIPSSLSDLTLLTAMSLNNNLLTGDLPDSFQFLGGLTNLDLSFNGLTGSLPPSMQSLASLTTMHIQNNQLAGTLDIIQDLPLMDLNIENNLFSGPVPAKLFGIPNFRKDGNPFNTTIAPAPSSVRQEVLPTPVVSTGNSSNRPSSGAPIRQSKKKSRKFILVVISVVASIIVFVLLIVVLFTYFSSRERKQISDQEKTSMWEDRVVNEGPRMEPMINSHLSVENNGICDEMHKIKEKPDNYEIDREGVTTLPSPLADKVIVNPINTEKTTLKMPSREKLKPPPSLTSAIPYSVASLQQYTDSFSEENFIIEDKLGKTYRAENSDGKLLVKKLNSINSKMSDDMFHKLILHIFELMHPNILELVGYCAEYGQRLLVYNYFSRRSLHDVLHEGDDARGKLSWNARIQIALGAGRALEYLHEGCKSPIIHQNFESSSVLLDDELAVRVCDCGLASILSSKNVIQLSSQINSTFSYDAPEISDSGTYTDRSDVYRFGVVMLELLTGREPYDSSRPRAEQYLVRWASSQLHDIDALTRMVDLSIAGKYPVKSLSRFADIISRCIQGGPKFRPPMSEVVLDLSRMVQEINKENGNSSYN